jgi:hypothetical protein
MINTLEYNQKLWEWLNKTKACCQVTSLNNAFDKIIESNLKKYEH